MAERSYNGRVIARDGIENSTTTEVTTTAGNWVESADTKIWFSRTNSSTLGNAYFQDINGERFVYVAGSNAADDGNARGGRLSNLPINQGTSGSNLVASSILDVVNYGIPVKIGRTYKLKFKVYHNTDIVSGGNGRKIEYNIFGWNSRSSTSINNLVTTAIATTGKDSITEYETNFTVKTDVQYLGWLLSAVEVGSGNLLSEAWFKDITIEEVLPTRTPATTRSTASNRVKVRDMGTALRFDGVDDVVTMSGLTRTTFAQLGTYTVSGWFRVNEYPSGGKEKCIWNFQDGGSNRHSFMFDSDGTIGFQRYNGTSYTGKLSRYKNTGIYYHYACVNNGGVMSLFINAVEQTSNGNLYASGDSNNSFKVGYMGTTNDAFCIKGLIDEPRIWSRALTAQEVSDLYFNNIVPRDGLVAEYLFNEASGTTALDTSGNGNDGTLSGCTYTLDVPLQLRDSI